MEDNLRNQLDEHFEGVAQLRNFYIKLDIEISKISNKYNFHCKNGCGACCMGNAINKEATVFELLPLAIELEISGKSNKYLEILENEDCPKNVCVCVVFVDNQKGLGHCGEYKYRPLVCRLFGDSMYHEKNNVVDFIGCHWLKELYENSLNKKQLHDLLPKMSETVFEGRCFSDNSYDTVIDINSALKTALELVKMKHDLIDGKLEF
ncbi:MAG: YkgJ family cysteine cluster protein [Bacteroidales bacterium]|nr:YkgJ family cysteine cluster protein [Bacteroidales bacterium]